jgi:hypothetical protein
MDAILSTVQLRVWLKVMPSPLLPESWHHARWWRGTLRLRVLPGAQLQQPAPFVIRALMLFGSRQERCRFTWRWLSTPLFGPPQPEQEFHLQVILQEPGGSGMWEDLGHWLRGPQVAHFSLLEQSELQLMSLQSLLAEQPFPSAAQQVQLQFQTPWDCKSERPGQPEVEKLLNALVNAPGVFLGQQNWQFVPLPRRSLQLNGLWWQSLRHLLKDKPWASSRTGRQRGAVQRLGGWVGPLLLHGGTADLEAWWPWLVLGSEFHLDGSKSVGTGSYRLSSGQSMLETQLAEPQLWASEWERIEREDDPLNGALPLCAQAIGAFLPHESP